MHDEFFNPNEDLHIPGAPGRQAPTFIDAYAARQAPRDLIPPRGSATANFDKSTGDLIIDFKDRLIQEEYIQKAVKWGRDEFGDTLTHLTLVVCAEAMQEFGQWLLMKGFERQPDNPRSAMYHWRLKLKPRRKKAQGQDFRHMDPEGP